MDLSCIILAAGLGTRMRSKKAKVLHEICFKPLLHYVVILAKSLHVKKTVAVVGHQEELIRHLFSDYEGLIFARQAEQLGTGHATKCALESLDDSDTNILIMCGDSPLLTRSTLKTLFDIHTESDAAVSILTAMTDDPRGYGRIVTDDDGNFVKIVEEKDATEAEKLISEVNTGTYIVKKDFLIDALDKLKNDNAQNEYYLTDITSIALKESNKIATHMTGDFFEVMGINTREDLAIANMVKQSELNTRFMLSGVTMLDPGTVYIEDGVIIGKDTTIYPGVTITGNTAIAEGATIHNGAIIKDSTIGERANILPYSVLEESIIEEKVSIGPFARLRPGTVIKEGARIGNFVEIKKSTIGQGSKAGHLTYLGDATVGADVNIGAGTITCNYDGVNKHETVIEDFAFIGSNTSIVAPVKIEEGALVGAGAVITKDVPKNTVAIERSPQKHYTKKSKGK